MKKGLKKYIKTQKYEQDCSLITTINAGIFFPTVKDFDINSSLYKDYYYNISDDSLSPEKIEGYIGITSKNIYPEINKIKQHLRKGNCSEMTTYHLLTGWHRVLLIPLHQGWKNDKVVVIDPVIDVLNNQERKNYYNWSKAIDIKFLFNLVKTYPNNVIECGKIRLFSKK